MAAINEEAIDDLAVSLQILIPDPPGGVTTDVVVSPRRITPTGLGGHIGYDDERIGDITGRRIEAAVTVSVESNNLGNLRTAVNAATLALLGAERGRLAELGVLSVNQEETVFAPGKGNIETAQMTFNVLYEYLKRPEASEEVISDIPVNLELG